jgi:NTE family protein
MNYLLWLTGLKTLQRFARVAGAGRTVCQRFHYATGARKNQPLYVLHCSKRGQSQSGLRKRPERWHDAPCCVAQGLLIVSLDTIIHSSLTAPSAARTSKRALVLMGGGARTAYQAGVLSGIARILQSQQLQATFDFPFKILTGTSAGALNAAFLASHAAQGVGGLAQLAHFWSELDSEAVYRIDASPWAKLHRLAAALSLTQTIRSSGALLNTMPLVDTLHKAISLPAIEHALAVGHLNALAVTASSYSTGVHWTFCQTAQHNPTRAWHRPGRRASMEPITIEHLMASSAIPFLFPPTPLWVDSHREYFGDGSMRQISPLSPAFHLGATHVMVIGVSQPQRSAFMSDALSDGAPSLASIAGHAMASVFHDTVHADVEQAQRVTQTLRQLPTAVAAALPYRPVEVLAIQPSQSLDTLALEHAHRLPEVAQQALGGRRSIGRGGAGLASYLLFEAPFITALLALGERDAQQNAAAIRDFFHSTTETTAAI